MVSNFALAFQELVGPVPEGFFNYFAYSNTARRKNVSKDILKMLISSLASFGWPENIKAKTDCSMKQIMLIFYECNYVYVY